MDQYRTEEEQVEALRRWWEENGRSTIAAIVIALSLGFGWQTWKGNDQRQSESASNLYQQMLQAVASGEVSAGQVKEGIELAEMLKSEYGGSTYAQFAALHLARLAVENDNLAEAEAQLRWVLGKASGDSDVAQVAQMRLARVLAASGDADQALAILEQTTQGSYQASYAVARGDILLALGRTDEARAAYTSARVLAAGDQGRVNLPALEQKLQSLNPVPARSLEQAVQTETAPQSVALDEKDDAVEALEDVVDDSTAADVGESLGE